MDTNLIQALWNRFETWLRVNAPMLLEQLQPGATDEQIAQAEDFMSVQFPEDFKASCLIHNGQMPYQSDLINARELLSLERVQDEWKLWKDLCDSGELNECSSAPVGSIRSDWWNPRWIPITSDGSGNHDCLDLNPAEGGQIGQIIDFYHDDATREIEAESFSAWFASFIESCEAGEYVCDEYNNIVDKSFL